MSAQNDGWTPGEAIPVECRYCSHEWLYTGMTPYAQCPDCQRSNNLLEDGDE